MPETPTGNTFLDFSKRCESVRLQLSQCRSETVNPQWTELCQNLEALRAQAEIDVNLILREAGRLRPLFLLYYPQGAGSVIPIMLESMPESLNKQISIARSVSRLVKTTPIQAYCFMSEVWAADWSSRNKVRPAQRSDKFAAIVLNIGNRQSFVSCSYTVDRDSRLKHLATQIEFSSPNPCYENLFAL